VSASLWNIASSGNSSQATSIRANDGSSKGGRFFSTRTHCFKFLDHPGFDHTHNERGPAILCCNETWRYAHWTCPARFHRRKPDVPRQCLAVFHGSVDTTGYEQKAYARRHSAECHLGFCWIYDPHVLLRPASWLHGARCHSGIPQSSAANSKHIHLIREGGIDWRITIFSLERLIPDMFER
jgi:hypothetical protein